MLKALCRLWSCEHQVSEEGHVVLWYTLKHHWQLIG